AVANRIDIHLNSGIEEVIKQQRRVFRYLYCRAHVGAQLIFLIDNFHCPATENIGWTNHQRITDVVSCEQGFFERTDNSIWWLSQAELFDHLLEAFTVFSSINSVRAGADNGHTFSFQRT